jgi:hypothetical protein
VCCGSGVGGFAFRPEGMVYEEPALISVKVAGGFCAMFFNSPLVP